MTKKIVKIAVVGAGSVGKSALVLRWIKNYFDETEEYIPTVQDSFEKTVEIDDEDYKIEVLDTAGQEEYEALRQTYMRNEEGFMLVFSITDKNSAVELNNFFDLISQSRKKDKHVPMVLIGNKIDLEEERKVDKKEIVELAQDWKCPLIETSAKTNENVDKAFMEICRACIENRISSGRSNRKGNNNDGGKCCILQ